MKLKLCFLDFDGVLNSMYFMLANQKKWNTHDGLGMIDEEAIKLLNQVIEKTNAKVVISSTWRLVFDMPTLVGFLKTKGFVGEVIGRTPNPYPTAEDDLGNPCSYSTRGQEIVRWIKGYDHRTCLHGEIANYVILDDTSDMYPVEHKLVQTSWELGLEQKHVDQAVQMLNDME